MVVGIYVWRGKAYLPVQAQFESGIYVDVEPVYTANLSVEDLVSAAEKVLAHGIAHLPNPTREEWRRHKSPILAATRASSWKALARNGTSYDIGWGDKEIRLDMSRLNKDGTWEFDPTRVRTFPPGTPLADIMAIVLEDIRSRPELR